MSLIILKRILVEGPNAPRCYLDVKYLRQKRTDILNVAINKVLSNNRLENLRYYITETETRSGYAGAAKSNESWYMKEISRKEISREELNQMFRK